MLSDVDQVELSDFERAGGGILSTTKCVERCRLSGDRLFDGLEFSLQIANLFGDESSLLMVVPAQHIMTRLDGPRAIVLFMPVGPEFDVPVFSHSQSIDFVELVDRIAAAKIEPPQNLAAHPGDKIVSRAELQFPQHRLWMKAIAECGVDGRLADAQVDETLAFSLFVRHFGLFDISPNARVESFGNEQAERKRPQHHFDRGFPAAFLGHHGDQFRGVGQHGFRKLEIFANPAAHRRELRRQIGLALGENLEFGLLIAEIAAENAAPHQ